MEKVREVSRHWESDLESVGTSLPYLLRVGLRSELVGS